MLRLKYIIVLLLLQCGLRANNINVSNILITDVDTVLDHARVQFDLSWDNSWRTSTHESNWDAAWVFMKYRVGSTGQWMHATLLTSGHFAPVGSTIATTTDGKGSFVYKSIVGSGTNTWNGVKLKWDYGSDGVEDSYAVEVCVFAIEMVYIPQGNFYVGDGTTTTLWGQFEGGLSGSPYQITSENSITLGGGSVSSLGNNNATGMAPSDDWNDVVSRVLPASFPKGHSAFYIMKYELSQGQYVEFLNKLTFTQQVSRTVSNPSSAAGTAALTNTNRNGIDIASPGVNPGTPAIYACNLNGNGVFNEAADGANIACNYLGWNDLAAYLDWAGLRPMTELEYEKACRGTQTSVVNEYAWGDVTLSCATAVSNSGLTNEIASTVAAKCNCNNSLGAIRVGCFAKSTTTTRTASGASYYGVLDLTGNLWEAAITTGNSSGRSYAGVHGDGNLLANGNADAVSWPGTTGNGVGYRGGAFTVTGNFLRVSSRVYQNYISNTRDLDFMGRGVRTP